MKLCDADGRVFGVVALVLLQCSRHLWLFDIHRSW